MPDFKDEVFVFGDAAQLAKATADRFSKLVHEAVAARQCCTVALAGGSTPKRFYQLLATEPAYRDAIPWNQIYFFFGDERHVPPTSEESNFRMANECLFSKLQLSPQNIFRIKAENPDANQAAFEYESEMRIFFESHHLLKNNFPSFDLILLGMGSDGHTASLFPESEGLQETERLVISNHVEKLKTDRITFTFPLLNHAAEILLLVAGEDKADRISEILGSKKNSEIYPVQRAKPLAGKKIWMLDQAAAKNLPSGKK